MTRSAHSSAPPPRRAARAAQRFRTRVYRSVIAGTVALLVGGSGVFAVAGAYAAIEPDGSAPTPAVSESTATPDPMVTEPVADASGSDQAGTALAVTPVEADVVAEATDGESAGKPELKITSFTVTESRFPCIPSLEIDFAWMPDAPESEWTNPDHSSIVVLVVDDEGAVVGQTNIDKVSAGGGSATYFIDPGHYTVKFEVPLTGGGTTIAREESVEVADPTIVVAAPKRVGNTVVVPTAPDGAEYFNVATGETVTGTLDLADIGTLTLDARSINGCALKHDGPWTFTATKTPLSSISNVQTDTSTPLQVTISFDYAIAPGVDKTSLFVQIPTVDGPPLRSWDVHFTEDGSFSATVSLPPGTYPLKIEGSLECGVDCSDVQTFYEGTFTVIGAPIEVTPTWPIQQGNIIKVVSQQGVIFTDKDGNVLTGDVPVPEGGITVTRTPEQGYVFPEGTDTDKTYEYVPPVPQPTEVTPVFPTQEPGNNVITFAPQPGVIFMDADGNVIDGSYTVTEGKTTITATPAKGYTFPDDASTEQTYTYYAATPTPTPQPTASPSPTATVTPTPQPSASASTGTGPGSNGTGNSGSKSPSGSTLATTGSDVSGITAGVAVLLLLAGTGTLMARAARRRS